MAVGGLSAAFDAAPEKNHSVALEVVLVRAKDLEQELLTSTMPEDHDLRHRATAILKQAYLIHAKAAGEAVHDVKPTTTDFSTKSHLKLKPLDVPNFSGKTEDWLPFWRQFSKAIHNNRDLDEEAKLSYLIQSLQETSVKATYSERMEEEGAYQKIIKELQTEHDKPRWMHRKYCESMKSLAPNLHTRAGMKDLISQVTTILNGFIRLKAENCRQILTSMTEAVMDPQLRALWNQRTDKLKDTPPVEDLLLFIKEQADQLEDVTAPPPKQHQEKKARPTQPKYKGSTNSAVTPTPPTSTRPAPQRTSNPQPTRSNYSTTNYVCPVCQDNHLLYYCPTFEGYTVPQRKEYVVSNKLCLNCLKPNHVAHDCRSNYRCKVRDCQRKHNTLLHEDRTASNTPTQTTHQTNAATHSATTEAPAAMKENLLMTSQVILTGPSGISLTVRALLDSGSTLSILSTKVMKTLSLKKTGSSVCIEGVGSSATTANHPMAKLTLSSSYNKDWSKEITIAGMDKVTRELPLQGASSVRELPHLKKLILADKHFDKPGRIDLLLGQNIWKQLFLPGRIKGPDDQPDAWHTVFGWTIMGTYTPDSHTGTLPAITHLVSSPEANQSTD